MENLSIKELQEINGGFAFIIGVAVGILAGAGSVIAGREIAEAFN